MLEKLLNIFTLSKSLENKIRRILELCAFAAGVILVLVSVLEFDLPNLTIGLLCISIIFNKLVEDLPRVGALVSKRRFWN
jgi:hypothetical protein